MIMKICTTSVISKYNKNTVASYYNVVQYKTILDAS